MVAHQLREQVADSKQNAILVVPQLAVMAADSSCGRLESPGGLAEARSKRSSPRLRTRARRRSGETAFPHDAPLGTACLSAHSGGYHAAACCLRGGGVDVRETYLFDALYAEIETFRDWVVARHGEPLHRRHKLVSYFTEGAQTEANNRRSCAAARTRRGALRGRAPGGRALSPRASRTPRPCSCARVSGTRRSPGRPTRSAIASSPPRFRATSRARGSLEKAAPGRSSAVAELC